MVNLISKIVAVSIGSNLGNTYENLLEAESLLLKLKNCKNFKFSKIYITSPVDSPNSPDYLNAAVIFETTLSPLELLSNLQHIETLNGRERPYINAPRTLDLDLLFYGLEIVNENNLTIPHPRLHNRFFVLTPLNDIAPNMQHPILQMTVMELERNLQEISDKNKFISLNQIGYEFTSS